MNGVVDVVHRVHRRLGLKNVGHRSSESFRRVTGCMFIHATRMADFCELGVQYLIA